LLGNILRNFAQACAIIVGGFGSWLLFDFVITARFVGGVALVIFSIFIYGTKIEQLTEWLYQALSIVGVRSQGTAYESVRLLLKIKKIKNHQDHIYNKTTHLRHQDRAADRVAVPSAKHCRRQESGQRV